MRMPRRLIARIVAYLFHSPLPTVYFGATTPTPDRGKLIWFEQEGTPLYSLRASGGTELKRGDTIGPYEIVQRLGGQKWAHVFSATRAMGGYRSAGVALKVPNLEGDPDAIEVFKMKAEIATFASHPNLVRTIEVGESG